MTSPTISNIWFTCLAELFADVHALPVGESSHHRGPRCRCDSRVNGVNVIAQVDRLLHTVQTYKVQQTLQLYIMSLF